MLVVRFVEHDGILPPSHWPAWRRFHRGTNAGQRLLECLVFLVGSQDFQTTAPAAKPASIMTENWRKKIAMSFTLTLPDPKVGRENSFALFPDRPE